eukprot:jgi/Mesen1/9338/ME000061S08787
MAKSRYEYVKQFELDDSLLPQCWIVIRIDGRAFTKFSAAHNFEKPNDERALNLMNRCAMAVLTDCSEVVFAYGVSDEYSKLVSVVASLFAAQFVLHWGSFFPETPLEYTPAFDGRAVCYPTDGILRDYLSWRQKGLTTTEAQLQIKVEETVKVREDGEPVKRRVRRVVTWHDDIIKDAFWTANPHILSA